MYCHLLLPLPHYWLGLGLEYRRELVYSAKITDPYIIFFIEKRYVNDGEHTEHINSIKRENYFFKICMMFLSASAWSSLQFPDNSVGQQALAVDHTL